MATALQMISWGLEVNDYGNAQLDADGNFIKVPGEGVTEELWAEMVAYANDKGWKKGDYKKLNLPFENKFLAQPAEMRERMVQRVEDFVYKMLTEVVDAADTAPLAVEAILEAGSYDLGAKGRIEDPAEWTEEKIVEKATTLDTDEGAEGQLRRLRRARRLGDVRRPQAPDVQTTRRAAGGTVAVRLRRAAATLASRAWRPPRCSGTVPALPTSTSAEGALCPAQRQLG